MNSVDDLKTNGDISQQAPTQTISLSAINNGGNTGAVSINATNGLTGVEAEEDNRPVIKITPNKKKPRRSITSVDELNIVDPDTIIEKPAPPPSKTPRDVAIGLLDEAMKRKQEEFKHFVETAEELDKANREKVEAGLETVEGEIQYMPDELHTPITEAEKVKAPVEEAQFNPEFMGNDGVDYSNDSTVNGFMSGVPSYEDDDDFDEDDIMNVSASELAAPEAHTKVSSTYGAAVENVDEIEEVEDQIVDEAEEEAPVQEAESEIENEMEFKEEQPQVIIPTNAFDPDLVAVTKKEESIDDVIQNSLNNGSFNTTTASIKDDPSTLDFEMDEADIEDVSDDVTEEIITDEEIQQIQEAAEANLKNEILTKIIKAGKKLNTEQYVMSTKVISIKDALKDTGKKPVRTGSWPMMFAGRPYISTALKGPEIALLADTDDSDSNNTVGVTMDQIRIMYEHDANPNRPSTLEAWAKTIPIYDVESIFAAMYLASLKDANYIPMVCAKQSCQHAYLTDNINIDDMVKFNSDDAKKRFEEIKAIQLTPENSTSYESVVNVINDEFAIGLKVPSVFTMLFEYASLNADFINKYMTMVSIIHYIDYIYKIDEDTQTFQPIGWKTYPGDNGKTFKSKIATYSKILKEFDDTDFSILMALINAMINKTADQKYLNYEIPTQKCPKCGSEIEARPVFPRGLLFTRQRLVELATTPTEK